MIRGKGFTHEEIMKIFLVTIFNNFPRWKTYDTALSLSLSLSDPLPSHYLSLSLSDGSEPLSSPSLTLFPPTISLSLSLYLTDLTLSLSVPIQPLSPSP